MSSHDHPAGALGDMARAEDMRALHSTEFPKQMREPERPQYGLCANLKPKDAGWMRCCLPHGHEGEHKHVSDKEWVTIGQARMQAKAITEFPKQTWNAETGETTTGECHAPPSNIYDVLSRLFEAAKRLELPWENPYNSYSGRNGNVHYAYLVNEDEENGEKRVLVTMDRDSSYALCRLESGYCFSDEIASFVLTTPADYARAYRWLVTGEQG
jgi:hypothetical protein